MLPALCSFQSMPGRKDTNAHLLKMPLPQDDAQHGSLELICSRRPFERKAICLVIEKWNIINLPSSMLPPCPELYLSHAQSATMSQFRMRLGTRTYITVTLMENHFLQPFCLKEYCLWACLALLHRRIFSMSLALGLPDAQHTSIELPVGHFHRCMPWTQRLQKEGHFIPKIEGRRMGYTAYNDSRDHERKKFCAASENILTETCNWKPTAFWKHAPKVAGIEESLILEKRSLPKHQTTRKTLIRTT